VLCDGSSGIIVDDSVASIASAVGELMDSPDQRIAMGMSARIRCESEFSLDLMAQRWRDALRPLMSPGAETARRGSLPPARRASALQRLTRSQRRSSDT
jgi:hypothetical protein